MTVLRKEQNTHYSEIEESLRRLKENLVLLQEGQVQLEKTGDNREGNRVHKLCQGGRIETMKVCIRNLEEQIMLMRKSAQ
jgi:hypothetical protein